MQAIIMAAGKGTRLGRLTQEVPKPLILLGGIPLLGRQLKALLNISKINEIIIITGYQEQKIKDYVQNNFSLNKIKFVSNKDYYSGALVTLSKAIPYIKEDFLVINADHLFSRKAYQTVINNLNKIMVCSFNNRIPFEDERKIKIYGNGVVELSKLVINYDFGYTGLVGVGLDFKDDYIKCMLEQLSIGNTNFHPDDLIFPLSKMGVPIQIFNLDEYTFIEIDTPNDYELAKEKIILLESEDK